MFALLTMYTPLWSSLEAQPQPFLMAAVSFTTWRCHRSTRGRRVADRGGWRGLWPRAVGRRAGHPSGSCPHRRGCLGLRGGDRAPSAPSHRPRRARGARPRRRAAARRRATAAAAAGGVRCRASSPQRRQPRGQGGGEAVPTARRVDPRGSRAMARGRLRVAAAATPGRWRGRGRRPRPARGPLRRRAGAGAGAADATTLRATLHTPAAATAGGRRGGVGRCQKTRRPPLPLGGRPLFSFCSLVVPTLAVVGSASRVRRRMPRLPAGGRHGQTTRRVSGNAALHPHQYRGAQAQRTASAASHFCGTCHQLPKDAPNL